MRGALERVGYEVVEVRDAARLFQRLDERPDLIVVSGAVPDMDLLELCVRAPEGSRRGEAPFVLVAEAAAQDRWRRREDRRGPRVPGQRGPGRGRRPAASSFRPRPDTQATVPPRVFP